MSHTSREGEGRFGPVLLVTPGFTTRTGEGHRPGLSPPPVKLSRFTVHQTLTPGRETQDLGVSSSTRREGRISVVPLWSEVPRTVADGPERTTRSV